MRCGFLTAPPPANEATPKWLRSKGQGVEALLARDDILNQEEASPSDARMSSFPGEGPTSKIP